MNHERPEANVKFKHMVCGMLHGMDVHKSNRKIYILCFVSSECPVLGCFREPYLVDIVVARRVFQNTGSMV